MDEQLNHHEEMGIDLKRAMTALVRRAWLVALAAVVGAVGAFLLSHMLLTPKYESAAMFYVNNSAGTESSSSSISTGDISAAKNLVDSYIVILNTNETMEAIADYAQVDYDAEELSEMISAAPVDATEIFAVTVESTDPAEAALIAQAVAEVLPQRISGIIDSTSAIVVDHPVLPEYPSSPNYVQNAIIGFLLGFVLAVGLILVREIFDITIRTGEDIEQNCSYPVLAQVPDMAAAGREGHYGYGRKTGQKSVPGKKLPFIGGEISFAASEAYKLLRTKLQFSFADGNDCHVIGVSSAMSGEGKSLSAANLAYSLAQLGKRVILIDCDMRKPTLAEKLHIEKYPGMSSLLSGQCGMDRVIQNCGIPGSEAAFHVIAAGVNPPNPTELLSSRNMAEAMNVLRRNYEYIILDLPPVGEVSDAMTVAGQTDGILLVVRQRHCNRLALADTIRQFEFVKARILGVIYNCTTESTEGAGKGYGYYRRSGKYAPRTSGQRQGKR